ncbi:MAG TPA: branched-chain amino acid ABC transporter permease [Acetobacteraceae bacterium]|nr:branched-chain amino acid ABC transporter permease [Acetobacteraceae bacterium]
MWREGLRQHRVWIAATLAGFALLAVAPSFLSPFHVRVGALFLFSAGLSLAWTILGGFAGYWSFGQTAFIGLGGFTAALLEPALHIRAPLLSLVVGAGAGGAVSALLAALLAWPILRLRGIYFAVAMLGVAQVLAELTSNVDAVKGAMGIVLKRVALHGVAQHVLYYRLFLALAFAILVIAFAIKISRLGQGLVSLREDEDTARMLGVPTERYKAAMFVLSATLTGLLGAVYAHSLGYITTDSVYRTDFSLDMIVYCLLGGIGTLVGPIIGAALMTVLTQVVLGELLSIHMFVTGALLVLLVLAAPRGIVGLFRPRRRPAPVTAARPART